MEATSAFGCVITCVVVAEQPLASVTVTVYVAAHRLFTEAPAVPPGFHMKLNGAVPPATAAVAYPSQAPKQVTLPNVTMLAVMDAGLVIEAVAVAVHPL